MCIRDRYSGRQCPPQRSYRRNRRTFRNYHRSGCNPFDLSGGGKVNPIFCCCGFDYIDIIQCKIASKVHPAWFSTAGKENGKTHSSSFYHCIYRLILSALRIWACPWYDAGKEICLVHHRIFPYCVADNASGGCRNYILYLLFFAIRLPENPAEEKFSVSGKYHYRGS